jgi:ribose 5-phosphate isomerase B
MYIGIAADHGGYELKIKLKAALEKIGYEIKDFGAYSLNPDDDYPDFVIPLAQAVAKGEVNRGIAICGSGIGACIAANKIPDIRAGLISDSFSAHQGVEDDDMNLLCLGARVIGYNLALELVQVFLDASYTKNERFKRRLLKVSQLEKK